MNREIKKRLQDILYAIDEIAIHISKVKSFNEYSSDVTVRRAVERDLSIIGEAVTQIRKQLPDFEITGMRKIISFRNIIVHEYDSVKNDSVWIIVNRHLPLLKTEVEKLLNE